MIYEYWHLQRQPVIWEVNIPHWDIATMLGLLEAISRANINMQISRPPMKKKMAEGKPKVKKKREKNVK